jgi:tRNA-Thr(GGU) m(6)t(6)A37 methyltransferase TsaA
MMEINLKPVAWVKNSRTTPTDDDWGAIISEIILAEDIPDNAFQHILDFSQLEIIYYFDKVKGNRILYSRKPRGNPDYPDMGIFAQRNKDRPNQIGLSTVELIWHRERSVGVRMLDAINGTPVLDIKPVFKEFRSPTEIRQPSWVGDMMRNYF